EELRVFNNTSSSTNKNLPGSAYFKKINAFIGNHYVYGELFMEYLKGACETSTGQLCDFCTNTPWVGPHMNRIPQPIPDYEKLPSYHYRSVFNTPINTDAGLPWDPDDYMPRAQFGKDFAAGKRILGNPEEVKTFAKKYIVKEEYITQYVQHLQELEWAKEIRTRTRQADAAEKKNKSFEDYACQELLEDGKLGKLTVAELNKYLAHHNLPLTGKNADNVRTIVMHLAAINVPMVFIDDEEEEQEMEAPEEIIAEIDSDDSDVAIEDFELDEIETGEDSDSDDDETVLFQSLVDAQVTRRGRQVKRHTANDYLFY
ncbi:Transient receptor potential cation channel subfamily A member 1, partial [Paramuricea clavata]